MRDFYANRFLSQIPPDLETVPESRTIGQDRVVDELNPLHALDGQLPACRASRRPASAWSSRWLSSCSSRATRLCMSTIPNWDHASLLFQVDQVDRRFPGCAQAMHPLNQ